jgi:hypothetical protein
MYGPTIIAYDVNEDNSSSSGDCHSSGDGSHMRRRCDGDVAFDAAGLLPMPIATKSDSHRTRGQG